MALPAINILKDLINQDRLTAYNNKVKSIYIKDIAARTNEISVIRGDGSEVTIPISADGANIHYGTTEYWNEQKSLVGEKSHIYIYSDYTVIDEKTIPNIKIGDGNAYLIDTPYITISVEEMLKAHIEDTEAHVSAEDREYWNNKVSCQLSESDDETVVFLK